MNTKVLDSELKFHDFKTELHLYMHALRVINACELPIWWN